jgi:hypothetical protein
MSKHKLIKIFTPILLGLSILAHPASAFAADYRNAGILSKDRTTYLYTSDKYNGITYEQHNEGGFNVYVPYNAFNTGQDKFRRMFSYLFDIYKSGVGVTYQNAAMLWNAPLHSNINGVETRYYTKYLSTTDNDQQSAMATSNLGDFSPNYNVEFRYAGIMIDTLNTQKGTVVTNPTYASDFIQEPKTAGKKGVAKTYFVYDKAKRETEEHNLKLIESNEVKRPDELIENWPGSSGVPSNIPSKSPYFGTAQEVFQTWAERTEIGAKYKAMYQNYEAAYGMPWWKILQKYMRIDGDIKTQSVVMTIVYNDSTQGGHTRYKTYYIPRPVENNVVAYKIQLLDDKDQIIDKSERPLEKVTDAFGGADATDKNLITNGRVKLKVGKTYKAELGMLYASTSHPHSQTDKANENSRPQIQVWADVSGQNGGDESGSFKEFGSNNTADLEGLNALEEDWMDHSLTGALKATGSYFVMSDLQNVSYLVGMSGYNVIAFTVDAAFPQKGHLRFIVPQVYSDNGDNEYKGDDAIELDYELEIDDEKKDDPKDPELYGDMNLGQREYRSLHYKKTVEEDDKDKPIMTTDPTTGEQVETGEYEKKMVDYEYATNFGWYDSYASSPDGEKVGEWNGVPEASGSIYPIDDHSWWEYDQQWPDQSADAYYKIWLTKAGDSWSPSDETYYRSETADADSDEFLITTYEIPQHLMGVIFLAQKRLVIRVKTPLFPQPFSHNILRGKRRHAMKKIFNHYILSAKEMDEIQYTIDWYHKYKILAELEWKSDEKDAEAPE